MRIEALNLSFGYGEKKPTFSSINLSVEKGEVLAILGANGAGKSTLLNCLANQLTPNCGQVKVNNKIITDMSRNEYARHVGYITQFHQPVFDYTVEEFVVMGRSAYVGPLAHPGKEDYAIAQRAMARMGISHLANRSYLHVSGGERQLVVFAQALAQQPDFLILDEPTSHLDFGNQIKCLQIIESLANEGYGVVLTSHFPDHSLMFDHKVGILYEGAILAMGRAEEVITSDYMKLIYGIETEVRFDPILQRTISIAR